MANVNIPLREREVIRAIIKALRTCDSSDLQALSVSYSVPFDIPVAREDSFESLALNLDGRVRCAADMLEALIR